jgi:hypothetical protein
VNDEYLKKFAKFFSELNISENDFLILLKACIRDLNHFPSIAEAMTIIQSFGIKINTQNIGYKPNVHCLRCNGSGWFYATDGKKDPIFGCEHCSTGKTLLSAPEASKNKLNKLCPPFKYLKPGVRPSEKEGEIPETFIPKVNGYTSAHEGLFMGYEERGYPSPFGLRHCKITEDEFLDVYHEWKNGRIHSSAQRMKGNETLGGTLLGKQ